MTTDISERGLETLIVRHLTGTDGLAAAPNTMVETPAPYGGAGYFAGSAHDYDRAHALDTAQLLAFLRATQPETVTKLAIGDDPGDPNRRKFLARLSAEIGKRGVIDVLRHGVDHGPAHLDLFYGTLSPGNARAAALHARNRFSITRQLAYSTDETRRALDLCLFVNGLPLATFELKNSLTAQTVEDAVQQYRRDRDPRERLFEFGRCTVHFAVDDAEVRMCTALAGADSWFLPFNRGDRDGAGNPPNPQGIKTDYLWRETLTPAGLTDIIEHYAQIVEERDRRTGRTFAIVIDEAHSSQGGKGTAAMSRALSDRAADEDAGQDPEDIVNEALARRRAARNMLTNASYFAFTSTPKNRTLELFGAPLPPDTEGRVRHRLFHAYTMKQAIEEGFILDVLRAYTPVNSYYRLIKKIVDDPEFDAKKARKKLRRYVEGHEHAVRLKAEIMVDHFHEQVLAVGKVGGEARAMVVTSGIERAIQYFHAFNAYLAERKSAYRAIVAFSGEHEYGGERVSEASLNGFPSGEIVEKIRTDPYRFLICADKFQTGYDEPLLHTMYVDKPLAGIQAVQTLSRLNRAHPAKHDCFVLDFQNNRAAITAAFQDYYRTTLLAEETGPNKLHDLKAALDAAQVYKQFVENDSFRRFVADVVYQLTSG